MLVASLTLVATVGLGACGDDGGGGGGGPAGRCTSGSGATACLADGGQVTVEGFLPGSTVTLTVTATTAASGAPATGASATGASSPVTNRPITVGADGTGSGSVAGLQGSLVVRGVSSTNRPVNLTLALR